jgi:lipopolysaccharide transport system permease protein
MPTGLLLPGVYALVVGVIASTRWRDARDQGMGMFLGPAFHPRSAMPQAAPPWLVLNPGMVSTGLRRVSLDAQWPQRDALAHYALAAVATYLSGLWVFAKLKKGFVDVL